MSLHLLAPARSLLERARCVLAITHAHIATPPAARLVAGAGLLALAVLAQGVAPRAASAEGGPFEVYTVRPGDTLSGIAASAGLTTERLGELNRLDQPDRLAIGTVLVLVRESVPSAPRAERAGATLSSASYRVQAGDTLSGIALRLDTDVATLVRMNALPSEHEIRIGTTLTVPGASAAVEAPVALQEHIVEDGDTVTGIAARFGVTPSAIASANQLRDLNRIRAGHVLVIPARMLPLPPPTVAEAVSDAAAELGLDPYLLLALSYMESGWQMDVVSSTGAVGMMQLMPETAVWAARDLLGRPFHWRSSLADNTHLGSAYLRHLLVLSRGHVPTALAAYYQGWTSLQTDGTYEETREYVEDVLALVERFRTRIPRW